MAEIRKENDSESSDVDILEVSLDNLSIEGKLNEFYTIFMSHLPVFTTACFTYLYSDSHVIVSWLCYCFYLSQNQQITFKIP
jgi:hypothetical protein